MIPRFLGFALAMALCCTLPVLAQSAAPTPTSDPLSFDDPGMHFKAPAGWVRIPTPPSDQTSGDGKAMLAAFSYHADKSDRRLITIVSEPFDGTLEGAESSHETDLRNDVDDTLVDKKVKTTLANGMPAYFIRASQGSDPFKELKRYDYVVYDGFRSIVVSYSGKPFDVNEDDAKKALASLYVVVYPMRQ